jgi:hypothetical protein
MASEKQIEANRANGRKSANKPRDTSRSRLNRVDHGLLAAGISPLDNADHYSALLDQLRRELEPQGEIESFLVERIALAIVRVKRASRFEAEAIASALFPEKRSQSRLDQEMEQQFAKIGGSTSIIEPGFDAKLRSETVTSLAEGLARYETTHERRLFKTIQELGRLQMARKTARSALPPAVPATSTCQTGSPDSLCLEKTSNANTQLPDLE